MGDQHKPVDIAKAAVEHAKKHGMSVVILDTAGRLHIDEAMMEELVEIKGECTCRLQHSGCRFHDRTGCSQCGHNFRR